MHAVRVKIKILNPLLIFINKKRLELNCFHEFMPFSTMASKHEQKQKQQNFQKSVCLLYKAVQLLKNKLYRRLFYCIILSGDVG